MITQTFKDIYTDELAEGAILNTEYHGFREDYLVLHCLLRKYQPKSVFEIGTNCGVGTKIIKNAVPDADVYSLDLPTELAHISLQHPINEGKGDRVGHKCDLPFTQLRGDSMKFDYSEFPCEAYFCDGEHSEKNVYHEMTEILKLDPKLIILHDTDIPEVMKGLLSASKKDGRYEIYRVEDTRISYLIKK